MSSPVLAVLPSWVAERRFHRVDNDVLLMTWCYAAGGWIADEPAMAAVRSQATYVYQPFDDLYVTCDSAGRLTDWPEIQEGEQAEIVMLPARPWIPIDQIAAVPYEAIADLDRDRRLHTVPVGSSQPPQPPGAGAAAAAGAESRAPAPPQRLEAALALAGGGWGLRDAHGAGYGVAQAIAADHDFSGGAGGGATRSRAAGVDAAVSLLESALLRALAPPPPRPAAEALALLDLLALADPWVAPIGSGQIPLWSSPPARLEVARPKPTPMPRHVADILLDKAIADGTACPITMESITKENGVVTSCGHLFERTAVTKWVSENGTCPQCRQSCSL